MAIDLIGSVTKFRAVLEDVRVVASADFAGTYSGQKLNPEHV